MTNRAAVFRPTPSQLPAPLPLLYKISPPVAILRAMTMSDLILDRANETCVLRDRPPAPRTGRPTRLTDEQVRRGRYLYWTGRVTAAALAVEWGLTRRAAAKVCSFVTLRHV